MRPLERGRVTFAVTVRLARGFVLAAVLTAGLMASASAHAHDGAIRWRTLVTAHTRVHYPARLKTFAQRVAETAEEALLTLRPLFRYVPPRRIELTIDDYSDDANGFAGAFPFDHVHIQAWPPLPGSDLADNGDWIRALVFHEVAHILHIGDASGVSTLINGVMGRTWLPNQFLPRFWIEGLAVHVETRYPGRDKAVRGKTPSKSQGGRDEAAPYMALLRGALRDGTWPSLAQLTGPPLAWPRGRGWYVFGSWLLDYQARAHGHSKLKRFIHGYGGRVVPYGINLLYRQIYGRSALAMWSEARRDLAARVTLERRLRRRGLVPPRASEDLPLAVSTLGASVSDGESARSVALPARAVPLTRDGEWRGRIRWMPDAAHVVFSRAPANGLARIERLHVATQRRTVLRVCPLNCDDVTPTPDGRWLVWIATRPVGRVYRRREVFAAPLIQTPGREVRLGSALRMGVDMRARNLSISPSGRWLLYVAVGRDGRTELRRMDLPAALSAVRRGKSRVKSVLIVRSDSHGMVLGSPTLDDAGTLYWTQGSGGQRRIWHQRFGASWQPMAASSPFGGRGVAGIAEVDGFMPRPAHVRWAHDLTWRRVRGVPTLAAVIQLGSFRDAATLRLDGLGRPWQLASWTDTGVTSTALSTKGEVTAIVVGGKGLDVLRLPPAPARAPAAAPLSALRPLQQLRFRPRPLRLTERPYDFATASWPRSWTPIVQIGASEGPLVADAVTLGVQLEGRDALETWNWQLLAQSDLKFNMPFVIATFGLTRYEPAWAFTFAWANAGLWSSEGGSYAYIPTSQFIAQTSGSWRYPYARGGWSLSWGWRGSLLKPRDDQAAWLLDSVEEVPFGQAPFRPFMGRTSSLNIGVTYDRSEMYPNSSVGERRHAIGLTAFVDGPWIGSELEQSHLDLHARWTTPLGRHRAIEFRGKLAYALTYAPSSPPFALMGLPATDVQALLFAGAAGDFGVVRGLVSDPLAGQRFAGRALAWGSVALHLPLPALGSGLELLPVFLGRTWLSVFVDAARVWAGEEARLRYQLTRGGWVASGGIELAVRLETAYISQGSLRFGFATAFGDTSSSQAYLRLGP